MGTITELSPQKRRKERYNLYVDGEFLCGINAESVLKNKLTEGSEIDGESLKRAIFESEAREAFEHGADYLSRGNKTERELADHLARRGYDGEIVEFTVAKLKSYHYVDDALWLDAYFAERAKGLGRYKIRQELRLHGVPEALAEERLAAFREDEDELVRLGERFMRGRAFDQKSRAALYRHLAGKGFEGEHVREAVKKIFTNEDTGSEDGQDF